MSIYTITASTLLLALITLARGAGGAVLAASPLSLGAVATANQAAMLQALKSRPAMGIQIRPDGARSDGTLGGTVTSCTRYASELPTPPFADGVVLSSNGLSVVFPTLRIDVNPDIGDSLVTVQDSSSGLIQDAFYPAYAFLAPVIGDKGTTELLVTLFMSADLSDPFSKLPNETVIMFNPDILRQSENPKPLINFGFASGSGFSFSSFNDRSLTSEEIGGLTEALAHVPGGISPDDISSSNRILTLHLPSGNTLQVASTDNGVHSCIILPNGASIFKAPTQKPIELLMFLGNIGLYDALRNKQEFAMGLARHALNGYGLLEARIDYCIRLLAKNGTCSLADAQNTGY